jgi:hypothetical protein
MQETIRFIILILYFFFFKFSCSISRKNILFIYHRPNGKVMARYLLVLYMLPIIWNCIFFNIDFVKYL